MRPVRLEMEGFGAFRDPTTIDFSGADFFALVGATGAGKSTVLDAICFALYGSVPRYDDQRLVGAALSLGANEARVRFTFEVSGEAYVVVRIVRRTGQQRVSTRAVRLERLADATVLAARESELRAAIEELLGVGFDDFTRCVVLPQGEFARFLHDKPADRQALLVRLLDLGLVSRLMQRANARAAEHQRELDRLGGQLVELAEPEPGEVEALRRRSDAVQRLHAAVLDVGPRLQRLDDEVGELRRNRAELDRFLVALRGVVVPDWLAGHDERATAVGGRVEAAAAAVLAATAAVEAAERSVEGSPDPGTLDALLVVHERIGHGRTVVAELAERAAEHERHRHAAVGALETASATRRAALDEQAALRRAHRAHSLAVELVPGEPCPVCEQLVDRLPFPSAPPALAAADEALRGAERELDRASAAADGAGRESATATAKLAAATARLAELEQDVAGWPDPVALRRRRDEAIEQRAALESARVARRRAEAEHVAARAEADRLLRLADDSRLELQRQRDPLVALGPPGAAGDVGRAWGELAAWASTKILELRADCDGVDATLARHADDRRVALAGLADTATQAGWAPSRGGRAPEPAELLAHAAREQARIEARTAALRAAETRRAELEAIRRTAASERAVAVELGRHLKTDRYQRWLLESALTELASRASTLLERLSGGQFALALGEQGEFVIIDHASADEVRSVRTLSGGETFQASLALALALSEHLLDLSDGRGPRALESIFLDEGFGTLDPESLEVVAGTIESLGSDGRTVGIVTHVRELADRVPVRFVVTKGSRSSTVERIDA